MHPKIVLSCRDGCHGQAFVLGRASLRLVVGEMRIRRYGSELWDGVQDGDEHGTKGDTAAHDLIAGRPQQPWRGLPAFRSP
jgi:hypothetical protein